jgi:PAS domain S-box-containing protein
MRSNLRVVTPPVPSPAGLCLSSPDCVKMLDPDGNVLFFNEDGLRLMGIDSLDLVKGVYWPLLWPEGARAMIEDSLQRARELGVVSFAAQCPTAKGMLRWWDVTVAAIPAEAGHFVVVSRDITEQRAAEQADREQRERLAAIVRSSGDIFWDIDLTTGKVWWGEGISARFGYAPDQIGDTTRWYRDNIHPDDRDRVVAGMEAAIADGTNWEDEFRYRIADGSFVDVCDRGAIIRANDGGPLRFVGVMQDITARNALLATQRLVAGEMAHRVNNLLAVVAGMFQQSIRTSDDIDSLSESFSGRLVAMSNASTAVMRGGGAGACLDELANKQLAPFIDSGRLVIDGDPVQLPETSSQPIALALNELATNAIKYGALSVPAGKILLQWRAAQAPEGVRLTIQWTESGGPPVVVPKRSGLGSRLIEHGIRGAHVERRFAPEGFSCSIALSI